MKSIKNKNELLSKSYCFSAVKNSYDSKHISKHLRIKIHKIDKTLQNEEDSTTEHVKIARKWKCELLGIMIVARASEIYMSDLFSKMKKTKISKHKIEMIFNLNALVPLTFVFAERIFFPSTNLSEHLRSQ